MSELSLPIIDQPWPQSDLEQVAHCPYCLSKKREVAFTQVQDWTFHSSPGKWSYCECTTCGALYLNPRPTESSIGNAYKSYYTHNLNSDSLHEKLKTLIRNELYSIYLAKDIYPQLNLPKKFRFLLTPFKWFLNTPYELDCLSTLPKGTLLDVGCGSGKTLKVANQLGWEVSGIEIDPNAVRSAQRDGLNVIHSSYEKLQDLSSTFDCIICSHVLEHVYQPLKMIELLSKALKPGGTLLLSLPNAKSHMRILFKENWRGLEAPRHIAIPPLEKVMELLTKNQLSIVRQVDAYGATYLASCRISRRSQKTNLIDFLRFKLFLSKQYRKQKPDSDFIQIVARKADI